MNIDYSIVIPAYNEVAFLPETIAAVKAAMRATSLTGEIIVCNNNSTDATGTLAEELGARVVFEPHNQISRARNTGAHHARGRYLVFIDADTRISAELLSEALERLESGGCCGGGSVVDIAEDVRPVVRRLINGWTRLSVKHHWAAGCFVFCLREDFEAVGGFSESVYASEEIWFSRAIGRLGKQRNQSFCIITAYPVISSGRKMHWFSVSQQWAVLVMVLLFPFLLRHRRFCDFWYKRPDEQ
jgi:glycosyltransferase involved in cell wall biosynthesis